MSAPIQKVTGDFGLLSVQEFIDVRGFVSECLKPDGSRGAEKGTRERQAEKLMRLGIIDIQAVLRHLQPKLPEPELVDDATDDPD